MPSIFPQRCNKLVRLFKRLWLGWRLAEIEFHSGIFVALWRNSMVWVNGYGKTARPPRGKQTAEDTDFSHSLIYGFTLHPQQQFPRQAVCPLRLWTRRTRDLSWGFVTRGLSSPILTGKTAVIHPIFLTPTPAWPPPNRRPCPAGSIPGARARRPAPSVPPGGSGSGICDWFSPGRFPG